MSKKLKKNYYLFKHSKVSKFFQPYYLSSIAVFYTYSIQGEKQHILPPFFIIFFAWFNAIQGYGKSKNIESIVFSNGNSP